MQNVVLWHSHLRVSWKTQCLSLVIHGALILLVLLSPWPQGSWPLWLLLVTLVIFDSLRSQRQIRRIQGEIALLNNFHIQWRRDEWAIKGKPMVFNRGILLKLMSTTTKRRQRMWLAIDSMDAEAWRSLRFHLLQKNNS
ncbi:protein YgfX [Budvicia diplopodorum]|uniref:protein YgfX n=1 Tax=Budvicia diplopodorum TaxID=1119056 RepID=UPI001357EBF1|nr:protein YgfX [Budvicia diplopodorum]